MYTTPRGRVVSFKMAPNAYLGHSQLGDTLEFLSRALPDVREVVLFSQFYIMEELDKATVHIERFHNLQSIEIHDTYGGPPDAESTLSRIFGRWGVAAPSLRRVQLRRETAWAPKMCTLDDETVRFEWSEEKEEGVEES